MAMLKVEETIALDAPVERVWSFLLDAAGVAACLPGARIDSVEDERSFTGTMKVTVGPVTTEFRGRARFAEVVPDEHRVRLEASGDDKGGSGSARMTMHGSVVEAPGGGAELRVVADVDLAGKLVRFGRGMMEGVGKQLFKQFAERVQAKLAVVAEPVPPPEALAPPAMPALAPVPEVAALPAGTTTTTPALAATPEAPPLPVAAPVAPALPAPVTENDSLDAGGLLLRALLEWLRGLLRRLLRRR
jgi:carbon monoxide dehydrogenase subunit G